MTTCTAPGKIILFGEHAVVYGRPAIAVPVFQVQAQATVVAHANLRVRIDAPDIARRYDLDEAPPDDPVATVVRLTCAHLGVEPRGWVLHIHSTIPVARGLGSGAAVSVAIARALLTFYGRTPGAEEVSALAFETEKLYHGTPSGIDNTVIAHGRPVYFVRGRPFESFGVAEPFCIAIGDTGIGSPTRIAVGDVRRAWEADRVQYEAWFDEIGAISVAARAAMEGGDIARLGPLMNRNHELARAIGVSSPEIETLVTAARAAGAPGAKLSGAGRGGNVIALVDARDSERVERAWQAAGAARVTVTQVR